MIGYPSDITRPCQADLYEIFNTVLYILRTGSQWHQLPHDFPNWQTVYGYFHRWSEPINIVGHSQLDLILKKLLIKVDYTWSVQPHFIHHSRCPKCQKY